MMRVLAVIAIVLIAILGAGLWALWNGSLGSHLGPGELTEVPIPKQTLEARRSFQRAAAAFVGATEPKQILFGDLHVHTAFSLDAFVASLPPEQGEGPHPPADACDFARYCSAVDFWSINDHAFGITPQHWAETIDSIRHCNEVAGDPADPDVVAFLGWEWTQIGFTPEDHYGNRTVVLRDLDPAHVPARPIGAAGLPTEVSPTANLLPLVLDALRAPSRAYLDATRFFREFRETPRCPEGVPVRELPKDCRELVATPRELFRKLDEWGSEFLVIPHGTAWGYNTPPGASWDNQLSSSAQHDPERQTMIEVFSGHGSSEEYRRWRSIASHENGLPSCPEPSADYLPSCWRAGEIIQSRCEAAGGPDCEARAIEARQNYVDAGLQGWKTVPGTPIEEWLDSGQCTDCFLPAFNFRPATSVQSLMARTGFEGAGRPQRFRFGFIASSDSHTGRPGTGYKELNRREMTEAEGAGKRGDQDSPELASRSLRVEDRGDRKTGFLQRIEGERANSFFLTGGLVAVHSEGRSRQELWEALRRNEVYGTSGPRILLWFDLLTASESDASGVLPMGSAGEVSETPRFRVRAVGSLEQRPGCPDYSVAALGPERLEHLCRGECYNPGDRRKRINRIEVVRIRPQAVPNEPVDELIEDPWRIYSCEPDPAGCTVEFSDPEFAEGKRDSLYYVRAIEEPSLAINAANLRCEYDEAARCIGISPCVDVPYQEDCLAETEERAWSSPIFVGYVNTESDLLSDPNGVE
jgi:hypothetical protein